jgi:predicted  nucleic acid-binding Zn-ribbon protein
MSRSATLEKVVEKSKKVHGDKYTYLDIIKEPNQHVKVVCVCPEHGEFTLRASRHYTEGKGCPKCSTSPTTLEEFLIRAKEKHGTYYDYSEVVFSTLKDKVRIKCPVHGEFVQKAGDHLLYYGCPKCGKAKAVKNTTKDTAWFVEQARKVHGDKYDYSKTVYTKAKDPLIITCPKHGDFIQKASSHIHINHGCPHCANFYGKSVEDFIEDAKEVHGNLYDYTETVYTGALKPVNIKCAKHGVFNQIASNHLSGSGCPSCAVTGFDGSKPGILYYLEITTEKGVLYKVGITNLTVQQRFSNKELSKIKVLRITEYGVGADAYKEEQKLLKKYSEYLYKGESVLKSGNTEIFTKDILGGSYE